MKFSGEPEIGRPSSATSFAAGPTCTRRSHAGFLAHAGCFVAAGLDLPAAGRDEGITRYSSPFSFLPTRFLPFTWCGTPCTHSFRVPVAALLAYRATAALSPWEQMAATAAGGIIAFAAHGGKTAARAAVTASPEPFSNAALSLGEDGLAIFLTWFATQHPYTAAAIVAVLLAIIVLLARWVLRSLRALFRGAEDLLVGKQEY